MKVIANHAHLMPKGSWLKGDVSLLLKHMDHNSIDMAVVFPPFACQCNDSMKEANLWALKEIEPYKDRLLPAGTLFPLAPDAIDLLGFLADEGVKWVKIHPSIDTYDIVDPRTEPFYALAERLGMILDYHTGPHGTRLSLASPQKFDDLAWDYPDLKFVFEHLGGRTYFEDFLAIINSHSNRRKSDGKEICVFGGLASILAPKQSMWYLGPEKVLDFIQICGADTLIFGLDFPWNKQEQTHKDIETIKGLDISEEDKDKILGGNLAKLLDI